MHFPRFRDLSIRTKLFLLTTSSVLIAATLISAAVLYNDGKVLTEAKRQEVIALAEVLGRNAIAAIEFDDQKTASELLSSLSNQRTIEAAALYDKDGNVFASYQAPHHITVNLFSKMPLPGEHFLDQSHLDVTRLIQHEGEATISTVGAVWIRASLAEVRLQRLTHLQTTIVVVGFALLVAIAVASLIQSAISHPVQELVDAARRIASEDRVEYRVQRRGNDELGELCGAFNHMLDRLALSYSELQNANDVLEQRVKERTSELEVALSEAQAANKAKTDFLANMSHEIRTPMTAVIGFTDLLEDEGISEAGKERLDTIRRNGRHLLSIINDILDVSKVEAGKLTVEKVDCSVPELLADTTSLLRAQAANKGLSLEVRYEKSIPEKIVTDPTRLRQILVNLVGNAIKFTPKGGIEVVVSCEDAQVEGTASAMQLKFDIIDSGIGMSPEQLSKIFRPFTQADETMTRRFGGTGLGLTISRALARMLGGDIHVTSESNIGSKFTLTVETGPLDGVPMIANCREVLSADKTARANRNSELPKLKGRILLVEDGRDNQRLISFLLQKAGAEVSVAENGQEGRDAALAAWQKNQPFDLVLMDMQMPVMDGYSATRELRDVGYKLPIVALTAHAMSHDRAQCLNAGCDDFLNKPINRAQLINVAHSWMTGKVGAQAKAEANEAASV